MFLLFLKNLQNIKSMKRIILSLLFGCGMWLTGSGQQQFFKSEIDLGERHLKEYYSSLAMQGSNVALMANNWTLYLYDKSTSQLQWSKYLGRKTNVPPFITSEYVFCINSDSVIVMGIKQGELLDTIPVEWFSTEPIIHNNVWYATGISNGGRVFAYDLGSKKMLWSQFIAHGCSVQPYYLTDRIVINSEMNQWITMSYEGIPLSCPPKKEEKQKRNEHTDPEEGEEEIIEEEIIDTEWQELDEACQEEFELLTHDGVKIKNDKMIKLTTKDYSGVGQVLHTGKYTLALNNGGTHILVLGNKAKRINLIDIARVTTIMPGDSETEILKAEGDKVWLFYNEQVFEYDFVKKAMIRTTDLSEWQPHQVVLDGDAFWLISKKDGQLYGIR
jgi:hypothetical protein